MPSVGDASGIVSENSPGLMKVSPSVKLPTDWSSWPPGEAGVAAGHEPRQVGRDVDEAPGVVLKAAGIAVVVELTELPGVATDRPGREGVVVVALRDRKQEAVLEGVGHAWDRDLVEARAELDDVGRSDAATAHQRAIGCHMATNPAIGEGEEGCPQRCVSLTTAHAGIGCEAVRAEGSVGVDSAERIDVFPHGAVEHAIGRREGLAVDADLHVAHIAGR